MNKISTTKIALLATLMGTMMATSTLFVNVHAAPTKILEGKGTGTYTCSDGTQIPVTLTQLIVNKGQKGQTKLAGNWFMLTQDFSSIQGSIYGGKISKTSYSLLAIEQGTDNVVCSSDGTPTKGTVTGECNKQGSLIQFRFENGAQATFNGNVVCY